MGKVKIVQNQSKMNITKIFIDDIEVRDVTDLKVSVTAGSLAEVVLTVMATELDMKLNDASVTKLPSYCRGGAFCGRDKNGVWHCECVNEKNY